MIPASALLISVCADAHAGAGPLAGACGSDILGDAGSQVRSCAAVPGLSASKYICLCSISVGFVLVCKSAVQKTAVSQSQCSQEIPGLLPAAGNWLK